MNRIFDPTGGDNNQPQPVQLQFHPVLTLFVPMFLQILHDTVSDPTSVEPVAAAWEMANDAYGRLGFRFVAPMSCEVIQKEEA